MGNIIVGIMFVALIVVIYDIILLEKKFITAKKLFEMHSKRLDKLESGSGRKETDDKV